MRRASATSLAVAIIALLLAAEGALGARVEVVEVGTDGLVGQELRLEAAPFDQNSHTVEPVPGGYRVSANGAGPVEAGPGCTDTTPEGGAGREVTCSGSNVIRSWFKLGDLADLLFAERMDVQVRAFGDADKDQLEGGIRADHLSGGGDIDSVEGRAGGDRLAGGAGADLLLGEGGSDRAFGGPGSDNLTGGPGDDTIVGQTGNDKLDGSQGEDLIVGGSGNDLIISSMGATFSSKDKARDVVNCGSGKDRVSADRKDKLTGCENVTYQG